MIKRMLVLLGSFVLLSGCAGDTQAASQNAKAKMMLETLKNEIVVDATEEHVLNVLESLGMGSSFIAAERLVTFSIPRESDEYYRSLKGRYVSIIRDVERSELSKKDISVQIDIGLDGRVTKVNMEPVYTAP